MAGKEFSDGRSIVEVAGRFEARTSKQEFVVGGNQKGLYPKGRKLSEKTTVWRLSEIQQIVNQ